MVVTSGPACIAGHRGDSGSAALGRESAVEELPAPRPPDLCEAREDAS